mgnify:CR=1 FL=1
MAIRHGNKTYMQILLDPHRAALLMELAAEKSVRPTALVREMVYKVLKQELPSSTYNEAVAKDEAAWRESVRKRVEGRMKPKVEEAPEGA